MLKQTFGIALALTALASCRNYDLRARLTSQDGLIPTDQFAGYGREQAEEMAVARELGAAIKESSSETAPKVDAAVAYARGLPDVADVQADPRGLRLTLRFKSGWRTMVTPIEDGKRGAETIRTSGGPTPKTTR
jgi:hypothetical protein